MYDSSPIVFFLNHVSNGYKKQLFSKKNGFFNFLFKFV
jgi:hypothetical protein